MFDTEQRKEMLIKFSLNDFGWIYQKTRILLYDRCFANRLM